jgi:hypothetical protein
VALIWEATHEYLPGLPIYLWVVLLEPGESEDYVVVLFFRSLPIFSSILCIALSPLGRQFS